MFHCHTHFPWVTEVEVWHEKTSSVAFNTEYNGRDSSTIITVPTETRPLLSTVPFPRPCQRKFNTFIHCITSTHELTMQLKAWHMYRSWCFNWHNMQEVKKMKVRKSSYCSINILFTNFHIVEHEYSPLLISKYTSNQNPDSVHLPQTYLLNSHLNIK
jgi:hypothetical protein